MLSDVMTAPTHFIGKEQKVDGTKRDATEANLDSGQEGSSHHGKQMRPSEAVLVDDCLSDHSNDFWSPDTTVRTYNNL